MPEYDSHSAGSYLNGNVIGILDYAELWSVVINNFGRVVPIDIEEGAGLSKTFFCVRIPLRINLRYRHHRVPISEFENRNNLRYVSSAAR